MKMNNFKQTEIDEIHKNWEVYKLGNYVNLIKGISYRSEDYCSENEGYLFINLKCVARNGGFRKEGIKFYKGNVKEEQFVKPGDIVIANTDLTQNREIIGSPMKIPDLKDNRKMCISLDLSKFDIINKELNNDFLYYYLMSPNARYFMISNSNGTTVLHLSTKNVPNMLIPVPSPPEQKAITSVLSSLDDKIDLLHRQNKTLEAMAETLFRQWFIEEADEEWEEVPLKDIYIFEKGFEPGSKNYLEEKEEDTIRFIRVGDMLSFTPSTYIKKNIALKTCNENDLLMSFDGTIGRINFGLEGAYSSGIRKIYSLNPLYDNLGLKYLILKSKDIQDMVNSHASGTVILHASSSIDYLTFNFPDENKLKKFNQLIAPIFSKIKANISQIHTLEKLRDTLLPKLMSGEVRIEYGVSK